MKRNRIVLIVSIIGLAALILMINVTSPTEIGPFGVLLFFTTLYIVSFGIIFFLFQAFTAVAFKNKFKTNKDFLYAAVAAFAPIMLLMARSFGAVNLWTISLIVIFVALSEFLVYKKI